MGRRNESFSPFIQAFVRARDSCQAPGMAAWMTAAMTKVPRARDVEGSFFQVEGFRSGEASALECGILFGFSQG